jgi:hypothetical protein
MGRESLLERIAPAIVVDQGIVLRIGSEISADRRVWPERTVSPCLVGDAEGVVRKNSHGYPPFIHSEVWA